MPLTAITRAVSPSMNQCQLAFVERQNIDIGKAVAQHGQYQACLASLGIAVVSLPAAPDYPDAVFVEDPAIVLDEVAIMTRMGAESRRGESAEPGRSPGAVPAAALDLWSRHARRRGRSAHRLQAIRGQIRAEQCLRHRSVGARVGPVRIFRRSRGHATLPAPQVGVHISGARYGPGQSRLGGSDGRSRIAK